MHRGREFDERLSVLLHKGHGFDEAPVRSCTETKISMQP